MTSQAQSSLGNPRPEPGVTSPRDLGMRELLSRNWWAVALRGLLAIIFGCIALLVPGAVMLSLALVFGAYLLVDGILAIVSAIRSARTGERWGGLLAEGIFNLIAGVIVILFPAGAVLGFVFFTAAWGILTGGTMMWSSWRLDNRHGRWWMMLAGFLSIVFGVLLIIAPLIGAVVLTWWLGGYAIAFGAALLVLAFHLRKQNRRGGAPSSPSAFEPA